ncbi:MAG TPA: hypothetical protein VE377_07955 [Candidatus Dormibacteraeota bacterium]|nr:hypothetical protein [Candidatus Dormibacteraeota bacterium]
MIEGAAYPAARSPSGCTILRAFAESDTLVTVLSFHIGLTVMLQFATTAVVLGAYAVTTSLREQKSNHVSDRHMVLFVSFLLDYHPTIKSLDAVIERVGSEAKETDDMYYFRPKFAAYAKEGKLPDFASAAGTTLWENLLFGILLAPLSAILSTVEMLEDLRNNLVRIKHTEYRKDGSSKCMLFLASSALMAIAAPEILRGRGRIVGMLFIVAGLVGTLASLGCLAVTIAQQQSWRAYWTDRLLEIMAVAEHEKNHDLFNRAMILNNYVDSQPDIPVPGRLGAYTAVYSGIQAVILLASKLLHFS